MSGVRRRETSCQKETSVAEESAPLRCCCNARIVGPASTGWMGQAPEACADGGCGFWEWVKPAKRRMPRRIKAADFRRYKRVLLSFTIVGVRYIAFRLY